MSAYLVYFAISAMEVRREKIRTLSPSFMMVFPSGIMTPPSLWIAPIKTPVGIPISLIGVPTIFIFLLAIISVISACPWISWFEMIFSFPWISFAKLLVTGHITDYTYRSESSLNILKSRINATIFSLRKFIEEILNYHVLKSDKACLTCLSRNGFQSC